MAAQTFIPLRPRGRRFSLSAAEMDCIVWKVISDCKSEDAFRIFVRPDLAASPKALKEYTRQFFSSLEVRDFMTMYREQLNNFGKEAEMSDEERESRAGKAVKRFTDKVIDKMSGDIDGVDEMDAIAKLADRVGVLAEKEDVIEKPRRYLPVSCLTGCTYRLFCEQGVANGDIVNECDYCKARQFAEKHGFVYDPTKVLDLPKKTEDIIDE